MNKLEGRREMLYQFSMSIIVDMFFQKLLSGAEYEKLKDSLKKKYQPIIGDIILEKDLI